MRLLFVADGRSPIALNWIEHFLEAGHEVHLVSTFPGRADPRLASYNFLPLAFSALKHGPAGSDQGKPSANSRRGGVWSASAVRARTTLRQWLGPLTLPAAARRLRAVIQQAQPELVHAMRIPYEGMAAALAAPAAPLVVSVWGNDFTLHAPSNPLMRRYTRRTLQRLDAIHADCRRDIRLAGEWGLPKGRRAFVLPGAGGVQAGIFYPPGDLPAEPLVIQPRGVRAYVKNEVFFQAVARVLQARPDVRFLCPNMAHEPQARRWVDEAGAAANVELLPAQTRSQMADLFRRAAAAVSPTVHDGTPNTLLEAMACGCLPVAGDLESLREWITPGENGLLVALNSPEPLAEAILQALNDADLRRRARQANLALIAARADYSQVMAEAEAIYRELIDAQ